MLSPCCCNIPSAKQNIREVLELFCLHNFFTNLTKRLHALSATSKSSPWQISQPFKRKADISHPALFQRRANRRKGTGEQEAAAAPWRHPSHRATGCCQTDPACSYAPLTKPGFTYRNYLFTSLNASNKSIYLLSQYLETPLLYMNKVTACVHSI